MRSPCLLSLLAFATALVVGGPVQAEEAAPALTIALPSSIELDKLAELTARFTEVSLQYDPVKLRGSVRLAVRGQLSKKELWGVFNQVLAGQGFSTVVTGQPAVYQVVPITEAPGLSVVMDREDVERLPFLPGYGVEIIDLTYLGTEPAMKALGALFSNTVSQVRTLGSERSKVVIAAPQGWIREARQLVERLDQPGLVPVVRLFRPLRTEPQAIQTAATAAWAAVSRVGARPRLAEVQTAPDGAQVVLIADGDDIERLEALVRDLDNAEPVETRTYRPRFFSVDEVGSLLQRLLDADQSTLPEGGADIVRDGLTNSLIVRATIAQHKRIEEVLKRLDDVPANARRQVRSLQVKHRRADELAKLISTMRSMAGPVPTAQDAEVAMPAGNNGAVQSLNQRPASDGQPGTASGATPGSQAISLPTPGVASDPSATGNRDDLVMSADMVTNRLIVMGDPRVLDQVQALLEELDQLQPQVELEVILVTLSNSENLDLGVELVRMIQMSQVSGGVSSLFGLSQAPATDPTLRSFGANGPSGLGGILIDPGDFAGVFTALERVSDAQSIIRSRVVTNNNAKSTIDGVVQQPLTSVNASNTVSTTSVTGTMDAGTQITITPQISSAGYVTVTYTISQSTFLGDPVTIANGAVIPPAKRADVLTSVATIPDGFVIGLGGLSNTSDSRGESRVPILGAIPILGHLFKKSSTTSSDSRFFVFIRVNVLRHRTFEDLRYLSEGQVDAAGLTDEDWPVLKPKLMR